MKRFILRRRVLRVVQESFVEHLAEDERTAIERALGIVTRREELGPSGETTEERGFGDRHVLRALAEEIARGLFDPVATVTEINVIEIELQNLVLPELLFQAPREECLFDFTRVGPLGVEEEILHDLLRDRRATLACATTLHIHDHRARDAEIVDPLVLVEARVFRGEHGELHVRRKVLHRDDGATFAKELREQRPITREHARDLRRMIGAEIRDARKVRFVVAHDQEERDGRGEHEQDPDDREANQDPRYFLRESSLFGLDLFDDSLRLFHRRLNARALLLHSLRRLSTGFLARFARLRERRTNGP